MAAACRATPVQGDPHAMSVLEKIAIVLATVAAMEGVAWAVHRYIMHGWGWAWHESHHRPRQGAFEQNDLYAVVFAVLSVALFAIGRQYWAPLWWIGLGMTIYGVLYALAHDALVHRRLPLLPVPKRGYLLRLHTAHHLHHAVHTRDGAVSFGFLFAPHPEKLRAQLARRKEAAQTLR